VAVFLGIVGVELIVQFANALLPTAARPGRIGLLSGVAFGMSQLAGILVLLIVLGLSSAAPRLFPDVANAVDRLVGPIAAVAILLFILPFLLVGRDRAGAGSASVQRGFSDLGRTLGLAWRDRTMRRFLIARMVAADGMAVVFSFGAVLAGLSFGWGAGTLAIFGLVITIFGAVGGFGAGWLDARIGTRAVMLSGIAMLAIATASVIATDSERLLGVATGVALGEPLRSPQEIGFLVAGGVIAIGAALTIAGMRTMMALLAPPDRIAAYFGLYAFVGKATAFIGPLLVGLVAQQTGSLRPGVAVAMGFLVAGFILMSGVRPQKSRLA
jgi:UMF1 family MFS transporter